MNVLSILKILEIQFGLIFTKRTDVISQATLSMRSAHESSMNSALAYVRIIPNISANLSTH